MKLRMRFRSSVNNMARKLAKATEAAPEPKVEEVKAIVAPVAVETVQPAAPQKKQSSKEAEAAKILLASAGNAAVKVLDVSPMKILRGAWNVGKAVKNGVVTTYQVGKGLHATAKMLSQVKNEGN